MNVSNALLTRTAVPTFFNRFVASINTSVLGPKLCTAAKYPTLFCKYFGDDMTSKT